VSQNGLLKKDIDKSFTIVSHFAKIALHEVKKSKI